MDYDQTDIRKVVDHLLRAEKRLVGAGQWRPSHDYKDWRFVREVAIEDEPIGCTITVKSQPPKLDDEFRIILEHGYPVWRLDYFSYEVHNNQPEGPGDIDVGLIEGAHYHAWVDNRRLCTKLSLTKELKFARLIPRNVKGFENAFRWFCGETRISLGPDDIPELPGRSTLL